MQEPEEIAALVTVLTALAKKGNVSFAKVMSDLQVAPANAHPPTPDTEPYSQADAIVLAVFNSLGKKQQVKIIRDALYKPRDKLKAIAIKESHTRLNHHKELFSMKKFAALSLFWIGVVSFIIIVSIFIYQILQKGSLTAEGSVIGSLFKTLGSILKVIWTAPTAGS